VIVLQRALERVCGPVSGTAVRLLVSSTAASEAHESIAVILVLSAAPDSERYDGQTREDNGSTNAHHNSNNCALCLRGHSG